MLGAPQAVPDAIFILAAAVWLVLVARYAVQGLRRVQADLGAGEVRAGGGDHPDGPGAALASTAFAAGRVVVVVFLAITGAAGGWLTGQWMAGNLDWDSTHPGYFLPTVASGLAGAKDHRCTSASSFSDQWPAL